MDYSKFERLKNYNLPAIAKSTSHRKDVVDLIQSIYEHYGTNNKASFSQLGQEYLTKIEAIHQNCHDFVYVGIEVELENYRAVKAITDDDVLIPYKFYWTEKEDGSLRNNGREFVSRFGMLREHTYDALLVLEKSVTTVTNNKIEANARTGLHVHIDVSQLTAYQFANLLFIYSIFEPMIFHVSGGRNENIFCVPWETNRKTLGQVVNELAEHNNLRNWRWRNYSKYCGLNLASLASFGTVEFRMHKGTYSAEEIQKWVDFLSNLYLYAKRTDFIDNLMRFRTNRMDWKYWDVFAEIFTPYAREIEQLQISNREELLTRCKYATISFFKHLVDPAKMPDSEHLNVKQAVLINNDPGEFIWDPDREAEERNVRNVRNVRMPQPNINFNDLVRNLDIDEDFHIAEERA